MWRPDVTSLATLVLTAFLVPAVIVTAVMSEGRSYLRGVALAGGSFNDGIHHDGPMTAANPGTYGVDWFYEVDGTDRTDADGLEFLASRGVDLLRIDFRWERLQPRLEGPLDEAEVARLTALLDAAADHELSVIMDVHNYGHYKATGSPDTSRAQGGWALGERELPYRAFADLWARMVQTWGAHSAVWGWELMNEPTRMDIPGYPPGVERWQAASQAAVDAIRAAEPATDHKAVLVAGYDWSSVSDWGAVNGDPWINDPVDDPDLLLYTAHHYWDGGRDSTYGDETPSQLSGSVDSHAAQIVEELWDFTQWLRRHDVRGAVTEVGWPDYAPQEWNGVAEAWFAEG